MNGAKSDWALVTNTIPQGSILSPVLFIIFINDLHVPEVVHSMAEMFTDDTKVIRPLRDEED